MVDAEWEAGHGAARYQPGAVVFVKPGQPPPAIRHIGISTFCKGPQPIDTQKAVIALRMLDYDRANLKEEPLLFGSLSRKPSPWDGQEGEGS
jgi:hypothetical protein